MLLFPYDNLVPSFSAGVGFESSSLLYNNKNKNFIIIVINDM